MLDKTKYALGIFMLVCTRYVMFPVVELDIMSVVLF